MKIAYPSSEYDDAVAAVCHGVASEEQARALHELLRDQPAARDEYILRVALHSTLASDRDLFVSAHIDKAAIFAGPDAKAGGPGGVSRIPRGWGMGKRILWPVALAAGVALMALGQWNRQHSRSPERILTTSKAVAMLSRTADAQWNRTNEVPRLGAPMEPGWIRLDAGLAEIIFYSGARLVVEGPAEVRLISQNHAFCHRGKMVAEVPSQALGFQIDTPHALFSAAGASYGLDASDRVTEAHVFKGQIKVDNGVETRGQMLAEGFGALIRKAEALRPITAQWGAFASLFDVEERSAAACARRHDQWRKSGKRLDGDPSLLLHFDFEDAGQPVWRLANSGKPEDDMPDATVVGCQWGKGRWPRKQALEYQSVNDRVRVSVPGEFHALTLAAWVCVKGLDRKINSLFMSDGFEPGTIHWLIRRDGVLGMTVIGQEKGDHQIVASAPMITLEKFGTWLHLAVVLDANTQRVIHYLNGFPVAETRLKIRPPFRVGAAELGNWNAKGFPADDPFMIRNFSGAMDEFCLFGRALDSREVRALFEQGKPQSDTVAAH
ncbi:MAG TPA: LamG-like jellyroll fold domain-containing protein [Verrucomicrobiae bacterium]|nr:LamG-like jellyroll fold domain-containing protein [Verrucomicrobiae bacterium]